MLFFRQRLSLALLLVISFSATGCNEVEKTLKNVAKKAISQKLSGKSDNTNSGGTNSTPQPAARHDGETIRIASFNIQVFGTSKESKPEAMKVLAETVRRFDVVAIQELRSKDTGVVPRFVEQINAAGRHYDYIVGPRLGRTSSKEQYVFVFDTERIEADPSSVFTVSDPHDMLHREPLVANFRVRGLPGQTGFSFQLINIHTDPDETDTELDALGQVYTAVVRQSTEDDVILLGDLNVDSRHLGALGRVPGITWVIDGEPTNTRRTKSYDNLIFHRPSTTEFTGYGGVFDFQEEFGLSRDEALDVSDHFPVWAEFSIREASGHLPVATRPSGAAK